MRHRFTCAALGLVTAFATAPRLGAQATNQYGNPFKHAPRPTSAAINVADLRTRLYIFADDSMLGRQTGTIGNQKGTDYIAAEVKRLGLEPAGDNGTYFQALRYGLRYFAPESHLAVGGQTLRWGRDIVPGQGSTPANATFDNAQVMFGGVAGDTTRQIAPALAIGRIVVLGEASALAPVVAGGRGGRGGGLPDSLQRRVDSLNALATQYQNQARLIQGGGRGGGRGGFGGGAANRFPGALAVLTVDLDALSDAQRQALIQPPRTATLLPEPAAAVTPGQPLGPVTAPLNLRITRAAAEQLMGAPLSGLALGAAGRTASVRVTMTERLTPEYGRNVVAILRGSDPVLRNEFVSIGAHNDHVGWTNTPVNHDSARAVASELYKLQMADGKNLRNATPELREAAIAAANTAANRRQWSTRLDSIRNGADDDGSGSMAVLEIAEALAMAREKPKRSVLFIWHTGEESGLTGSRFYADNPTVPREAIVANVNIDMIGRGRAEDIIGGGPDYLTVIGSNRLSSDLARMVTTANQKQSRELKLDYKFDDVTDWAGYNNLYGRSDHFNYARHNIPIAFFFTGLHYDYHQVTDEPQYIDYPHYARITSYIRDLMLEIGNAPQRPRVDRAVQ